MFRFWAGQDLELRKNNIFCGFKSSLAVNLHVPKPELSQKCLKSFVFQKVPIWQRLLANQLRGFEF